MMIPPTMTNSLENTENQLNLKKEEESVHLLDVLKGKSDFFLSFNACLRCLLSSFYFEKGDLFYILSLFFCFADWQFRVLKTRPGVFQFSSFLSGITNLFQYFRECLPIQMFPLFTCRSICVSQNVYFEIGVKIIEISLKKQTNAFKNCSNSFRMCFKLTSERLYKVLYLKQNFN